MQSKRYLPLSSRAKSLSPYLRRKAASPLKRLKAAAAAFEAIAADDDAHPDITELATKGYRSTQGIFATGGDSASDYDENGNYTGSEIHAYMADGESGGKSADTKSLADAVREPLGHAREIVAHEHATDFDRMLAAKAANSLESIANDYSEQHDMNPLRQHLVDNFGLPEDADEQTVRQKAADLLASGELSSKKYLELITAPEHHAGETQRKETTMPDSRVQPKDMFGGTGTVRVKKPSEMYCSKTVDATHVKYGHAVKRNGQAIQTPSDQQLAKSGVFLKAALLRQIPSLGRLTEHEENLLKEVLVEDRFVGPTADGRYIDGDGVKLPELFGNKGTSLVSDATSGGAEMVPFYFDDLVVSYPLLSAELAPYVDMQDLTVSNSVKTSRMNNFSASWAGAPSEGSGASVTLQNTDSLVDSISTSVFDVRVATTFGLNFMADSPVNVMKEIQTRIGSRVAAELDKVIAVGDGTTQPKGLQNTSGTVTVTPTNSTAGPWLVKDLLNVVKSLPKQYRQNDPSVCFVMSDAAYMKIRGIVTGLSGDQRLVYGYDLERYILHSRPVRISNDLAANYLFFLPLRLYRMFRRKGLEFTVTKEGQTLVLSNQLLVSGRGRYGGQVTDANGVVTISTGSLH